MKRIKRSSRPGDSFIQKIERHIKNGTCYICGRPILAGEARYTLMECHWNCHARRHGELRKQFGWDQEEEKDQPGDIPYLGRANGGELGHWVMPRSRRALCGHKPKDTSRKMRTRGKWIRLKPEAKVKMCAKCVKKNRSDHVSA